jgi:RHS repeat-associated protein
VTDWSNRVTTYNCDRLGRLIGTIRPNGTSNQITHDAANQLTSIKESVGGKLINYLAFQYDAASQIKSRFRAPLVNSGWQHPTFTATYDDDNRLLTVNGSSVVHDDDGNMTLGPITPASGNVALGYNSRNQLTNAVGISYTYDAEGRRRTLTDTSGTTRDIIDPSGKLLVRINPDSTRTYYVYGPGLLYEVDGQSNATKTYHFDQVGSTIVRTNDAGSVIGKAEYSAYGLITWKDGDMATPFLYNGQAGVQTEPNGLFNMRARYYSPYLMRFLNADPIGFSGGSNWFAYADGNPISESDPFGLDAIFLYGRNDTNSDYFKVHAQAQANQFNLEHREIAGTTSSGIAPPYGPLPSAVYRQTETAYVFSMGNTSEFNTALTSTKGISNITYVGHSWGLGDNVNLPQLDRLNVLPSAKIYLNGCYTGLDDNNSGSFSAQRYADSFGLPTRGITEGVSFGLPIPNPFSGKYYDLMPGNMRGEGRATSPNFMWANPSNHSK